MITVDAVFALAVLIGVSSLSLLVGAGLGHYAAVKKENEDA